MRARLKIAPYPGLAPSALFAETPHPMSAADIESILVRASRRMASARQSTLTATMLRELIADFQPPAYPLEIEYQKLIAAFECTSRALLPPELAAMPPDAIASRLAELRVALGR